MDKSWNFHTVEYLAIKGDAKVASYKGPYSVDSVYMKVHNGQRTCFYRGIKYISDCLEPEWDLGATANGVSSWRDKYVWKVDCDDGYTILWTY